MKHPHYFLAALIACGTLSACQSTLDDATDDDALQSQMLTVSVDPIVWTSTTRAEPQAPTLPVHYYLYDQATSAFIADQEITTGTEYTANFSVSKGSYTLYVVTGTSLGDYTQVDHNKNFTFDPVALNADVCLGHTDVTISQYYAEAQNISINAQHVFSRFEIELSDVPASFTSVTAKLQGLANAISWDGVYVTSSDVAQLSLTTDAQDGATTKDWSYKHYTYPCTQDKLSIGLSFAIGDTEKEYMTTEITNPLTSGNILKIVTPYTASSTSSGLIISGWTTTGETHPTWTVGGDKTQSDENSYTAGDIYTDHVLVIKVDTENKELLLMGTQYTTNTGNFDSYLTKNALSDKWGVPTKEQWDEVTTLLGTSISDFNTAIKAKDENASQVKSNNYFSIQNEETPYYSFYTQYVSASDAGNPATSYVFPVATISYKQVAK